MRTDVRLPKANRSVIGSVPFWLAWGGRSEWSQDVTKMIKKTLGMLFAAAVVLSLTDVAGQPPAQKAAAPNPDSQYRLGPDSLPQDGVPKGDIKGPFTLPCKVYEGTQHTYWVYVPAQYDAAIPTALMVYQDGQAFKNGEGHEFPLSKR